MALYTLLLALGAAVPHRVSYSPSIRSRFGRSVGGGGYQRREPRVAADDDEQAQTFRREHSASGLGSRPEPGPCPPLTGPDQGSRPVDRGS